MQENYIQIPTMLAILTINGDYLYVDRLAYTPSKDLALFYLREAYRALHAIKRNPPKDIKENTDVAKMLEGLESKRLENEISVIADRCNDTRKLRETLSLICSKALAKSAQFIKTKEV
ncbi:MAG: type I-A CRISPR-associated protein Csa5 [Candidatus Nitrosocaldaceae archaeon]|nr:MAG: type I-A CRISPR-associated protein Csa5 [Candidatus Nitrosocaldaceae archaeon]